MSLYRRGSDGGGMDDHNRGQKRILATPAPRRSASTRAGSACSTAILACRSTMARRLWQRCRVPPSAMRQGPILSFAASVRTATFSDRSRTAPGPNGFGTVKVRNPRWMLCQDCYPGMVAAFAPLKEICPDRATSKLMELTARLGSMMPYRQAAKVLSEFLPIEPTEPHATVRKRTIKTGERLDCPASAAMSSSPRSVAAS